MLVDGFRHTNHIIAYWHGDDSAARLSLSSLLCFFLRRHQPLLHLLPCGPNTACSTYMLICGIPLFILCLVETSVLSFCSGGVGSRRSFVEETNPLCPLFIHLRSAACLPVRLETKHIMHFGRVLVTQLPFQTDPLGAAPRRCPNRST